jgi:hypothetical protein
MKKLLIGIMTMLMFNCASTSGTKVPGPKFKAGECVGPSPAELAALSPSDKQQLKNFQFKVIDVGTKYYVVEMSMLGRVLGQQAGVHKEVEAAFVAAECVDFNPSTAPTKSMRIKK